MTDPRPVGEPMIRLDELTKRYPGQAAPAVDAISLDVPAGEVVVFVGPSGCGKTTTLKMINRIIEPTSGRIVLDGEASALRENEDVKEFYLGIAGEGRKSFKDVKHYKRRKRWLA